jgi:hypothetical protein
MSVPDATRKIRTSTDMYAWLLMVAIDKKLEEYMYYLHQQVEQ